MAHRVLILGNTGMLGHMVEHVLAADTRFTVRGVGRAACNVFDVIASHGEAIPANGALHALLSRADSVINCIGITARHIDDADPASVARAIRVNAEFPHALAAVAAQHGVRVLHMSTDGVFSGQIVDSYTEDAIPDATDTYGRTKLLGESRASNVLNVRCSIVGPSPVKHEGLWEWIASQPDGATVDGYTNHVWHGATTMQFAEFCQRILVEDRFDVLRAGGHVLHFAPNAPATKMELVTAVAEALGKPITVRSVPHAQSIHRTLAMRADVVAVLGGAQSIVTALRACAMMTA